jgi:hypothetical protein
MTVAIARGDLATAYISTGIPNMTVGRTRNDNDLPDWKPIAAIGRTCHLALRFGG